MHGIERTRKLQEELPQSMRVTRVVFRYTDGRTLTFIPEAGREAFIEDDMIELSLDFVTLSLSPTEFIQLAASLRLSVDGLLDHHPAMQRAVVAAFDIKT